jgi:diguanylate cyclase (GGDEF)-like protein
MFDTLGKITNYLSIKENITEQLQAEARIQHLAYFDQLTGLPNRIRLNDRFNYSISLAQRAEHTLTVMFFDLDHFKIINDTLGHNAGDQLLVEVTRRFKTVLREEDTLSRMGGDEFILLLPETDGVGASVVAAKLLNLVAEPFMFNGNEIVSTISIGIALYPHDGHDVETLSKNADTAMYRVKKSGRNNFCFFTKEMLAHSTRILQLTNALRHALARDELELYYQPQTAMEDGRIIGAEALLRWQHRELGMISPSEFIPIAESSGLIVEIGEWVLSTAVKQLKYWLDIGLPSMMVAVNISAVQFRHPNLPELVSKLLDEYQLPPEYLELELTESVAMDEPIAAIAVMNDLHSRGVRMSIDDFGTGYSSLSYLKKFKVYKLKIDQSFVRDISTNADDKAIVTTIINMAGSLGMQTIAEGVETADQLEFLRLQGCDEIQGYYFSPPLSKDDFEAYARKKMT